MSIKPGGEKDVRSIAVLPFKPLVAANRDEAFEMGIAETLINSLSNARQLMVRPFSAVRQYTNLDQDALAAGREQKVEAVLEGSIQRDGNDIRITARLLNTADGRVLWSDQFNEKSTNIFALEDTIAARVIKTLALNLTAAEQERLTKHTTRYDEAYQLYLKGRYFTNKWNQDGWKRGIEYFRQAIALDPDYALAYAGLAETYAKVAGDYLSNEQARPRAEEAVARALALDEGLAEAHVTLAWMKAEFDWDWDAADREFRRGIELNPAAAHELFGYYLRARGRFDEAIAELRRAQKYEPLSLEILTIQAMTYCYMKQYDHAIEQYQKVIEMDANSTLAHEGLGISLLLEGKNDAAIVELLKEAASIGMSTRRIAELKAAYATAGFSGYWRKWLEWTKDGTTSSYQVARMYAQLGKKDLALNYLEKAYAERNVYLIELSVDPLLGILHDDAHFQDLVRRVGFTP